MLNRQVDVNALNKHGDSALSYLLDKAFNSKIDTALKLLLAHGAHIDERERQRLNELQKEAPVRYASLQQQIPELFR